MGKNDGFMIYNRASNNVRPAAERIKDFKEFKTPLDESERRHQAARCMDCGVPMCQSAIKLAGMVTGCPLHNLIPEWNDALYGGYYKTALGRLVFTSSFPEFTGRVCPALCEKACNCGSEDLDNAVSIHDNELFIIEKAFQDGLMKPHIPKVRTDKKVAVVGSGPAGLAVADMLNRRGHFVTVFEREDSPGGLLMYGIPNMKLDKSVVRRRVELMQAEGVEFKCGVDVGRDGKAGGSRHCEQSEAISVDVGRDGTDAAAMLRDYDAVALCCGAKKARTLNVPGADAGGVMMAVDFLTAVTKSLIASNLTDGTLPDIKGKAVVVVGGGDTGNDCVGTAIRLGAASVSQIEMMPRPPEVRTANNPWPQWPKILKTDYGQEEAIAVFGKEPRTWSATVKEVLKDDGGHVRAVVVVNVEMKEADGKRQLVNVEGSEREVPCDLLLVAAGFVGCEEYTAQAFGAALGPRGTVACGHDVRVAESPRASRCERGSSEAVYRGDPCPDDNLPYYAHMTSVTGLFSAGDMRRGQSLVVWAIAEGRECAREMDKYLMGYTNL